jgi:hypothetical protein
VNALGLGNSTVPLGRDLLRDIIQYSVPRQKITEVVADCFRPLTEIGLPPSPSERGRETALSTEQNSTLHQVINGAFGTAKLPGQNSPEG